MKEHLRDYFPQRFEDSNPLKLGNKIFELLESTNDRRSRAKCETIVTNVFNRSNELQLLAGAMKKYGCDFNLLRHVSCERCKNCAGGFDPDTNQIIICYTQSLNRHKIMATMMHEMVHMFDYCRVNFDFDNLEHVACSEIRAANLTYCSIADRLVHGGPGLFDFKKTHQFCVKDVAFQSVKAYSPETGDEKLWSIIDKVFPDCYNDLEPFGRRPTGGVRNLKHSYRERYHYGYVY
jgi:inner membrane protease ATP23